MLFPSTNCFMVHLFHSISFSNKLLRKQCLFCLTSTTFVKGICESKETKMKESVCSLQYIYIKDRMMSMSLTQLK